VNRTLVMRWTSAVRDAPAPFAPHGLVQPSGACSSTQPRRGLSPPSRWPPLGSVTFDNLSS
jgi:hypothetical protein